MRANPTVRATGNPISGDVVDDTMRLHRDCRNFEERGPTVFIHADGAGLRSEPSGGCRLGLIGFAGCPAACTERQAR